MVSTDTRSVSRRFLVRYGSGFEEEFCRRLNQSWVAVGESKYRGATGSLDELEGCESWEVLSESLLVKGGVMGLGVRVPELSDEEYLSLSWLNGV